uniref:Kinesin motor domain-containing protein n=1 Tax=Compsopogon caeruleus TaxID=31354 RepID=A0A7S1T9W5_9RHOD|mmetsp:Transcript_13981/g.28623  ORF Transcript_13981/g.28623 Transcript_13981/m.28623 type:complete len:1096 (+) Transcript_13981:244-3531(+)
MTERESSRNLRMEGSSTKFGFRIRNSARGGGGGAGGGGGGEYGFAGSGGSGGSGGGGGISERKENEVPNRWDGGAALVGANAGSVVTLGTTQQQQQQPQQQKNLAARFSLKSSGGVLDDSSAVRCTTPPSVKDDYKGLKSLLVETRLASETYCESRVDRLSEKYQTDADTMEALATQKSYNPSQREANRKLRVELKKALEVKKQILEECSRIEKGLLSEQIQYRMTLQACRDVHDELQQRNMELLELSSRLGNEVDQTKRELSVLQGEKAKLVDQLKAATLVVKITGDAKAKADHDLKALSNTLTERENQLCGLDQAIDEKNEEIDCLRRKIAALESQHEQSIQDHKNQSNRLLEREREVAKCHLRDAQHSFEVSLTNKDEEILALKTDLSTLRTKTDAEAQKFILQRDELLDRQRMLETDLKSNRSRFDAVASENARLTDALNSTREKQERLLQQTESLNNEIERLNQRLEEKQNQLENGIETFQKANQAVEARLAESMTEKNFFLQRISVLESKIAASDDDLRRATALCEERARHIQHLDQEKSDLVHANRSLESEIGEGRTRGLRLEGELKVVKELYSEANKDLTILREEYCRAKEQISQERIYLQAESQRVKDEKQEIQSRFESELSLVRDERNKLSDSFHRIIDERDVLASEITVLRDQNLSGRFSPTGRLERQVELQIESDQLRRQLQEARYLEEKLESLEGENAYLRRRLLESESTRRKLHNTVQDMKGNVRVFARVRPVLCTVEAPEGCIVCPRETAESLVLTHAGEKHSFIFDRIFAASSSQSDVFSETSDFIQSALDGYHVCLFSYGQTGSGKTFTMEGRGDGPDRGLIPRSVEQILATATQMKSSGWEFSITASFLEIYNEEIRDLLCRSKESLALQIKRNSYSGRMEVSGATQEPVDRIDKIHELMKRASKLRSVAATDMNSKSSRSHSIFLLRLEGVCSANGVTLSGSLNLCDLAGSERLSRSCATGDRLRETQAINKSLSALVDVFDALKRKNSHVPFRNSKLTYLLQDCLGGDGKTLMMVNLAAEPSSASESLCSLRFASQVNQTELGRAKRNLSSVHSDTSFEMTPRTEDRRKKLSARK